MPTYDYVCSQCGYAFEKFQSITAHALRKCPRCGQATLNRLIGTGAGVIFKGSGFYQTDYRSEAYKQAAKAEQSAATPAKDTEKTPSAEAAKAAPASKPRAKSGAARPGKRRQAV